ALFSAILLIVVMSYTAFAQSPLPTRAELEEGWNQIFTGEGTTCSRGTEYSFFARPAEGEKLMIYFEGGGACWDESMCSVDSGTFVDAVRPLTEDSYQFGIFDIDNPQNPLADYNMVVVPYCTGDIHTGDQTVNYNDELTIYHHGAINANAVLDWVFENYPNPEDVVIAGCSAGAYGAIYHAYRIMSQYPEVAISLVGDSGVGIAKPDWNGLELWGTLNSLPDELKEGADLSSPDTFTSQLYTRIATLFPNNFVTQYTTVTDEVQTAFYFFQGGIGWRGQMEQSLTELNENLPNFSAFVAGGDGHCILPRPEFYTWGANGVAFHEWFSELVANDSVEDVVCTNCNEVEVIE
ncbi:MAG: hypothetical protein CUN55_11970, partial [Phototrophicales bacterium]